MPHRTRYYTLVSSLPAMPASFEDAGRVPISELKLRERLKMLSPCDAEIVADIAEFMTWERQPLERRDDEIVHYAERFMREVVHDPFVVEVIRTAMVSRTILSALRRRRLEMEPPVGIEPMASHIRRNWTHPGFRLAGRFPWIRDLSDGLSRGDLSEVERVRLNVGWRYARQISEQHHFTFQAVVAYLIRWELVYRWTRRDAGRGRSRFESLAAEAMGEFSDIFNANRD